MVDIPIAKYIPLTSRSCSFSIVVSLEFCFATILPSITEFALLMYPTKPPTLALP